MVMIIKGACIENQKLLVLGKKGIYDLPGRELEKREHHHNSLIDVFNLELNGAEIKRTAVYYGNFLEVRINEKENLDTLVYFVYLDNKLKGVSNQTSDYRFITSKTNLNFPKITKKIILSLNGRGFIK